MKKMIKQKVRLFMLLSILILSQQTQQAQMERVIICFGYTQTGKSSLIRHLTGDDSIKVGDLATGQSTTRSINVYRIIKPRISIKLVFIDTIGLGDNSLNFTPQEIRQSIQNKILQLSTSQGFNEIHGIFITESLKDSANQLRNVLEQVSQVFGKIPSQSIVVIGTKSNDVKNFQQVEIREKQLKDIMKQYNIPLNHYVRFVTPYEYLHQKDIPNSQYTQLENSIQRCKPLDSNLIKMKFERIKARAQKIQKDKTTIQKIPHTNTHCTQSNSRILGIKISSSRDCTTTTSYTDKTNVPDFKLCYQQALQEFQQQTRHKLITPL